MASLEFVYGLLLGNCGYQTDRKIYDQSEVAVRLRSSRDTRLSCRMTYAIPKARTNYGILNIRFQGVKVWNDIGDDIKLLPLKHLKNK